MVEQPAAPFQPAPLVSVVIPVGPRHAAHVRTAAASVAAQSLAQLCETIVVPDGGAVVPPMPGVQVLEGNNTRLGPAKTRNRGIAAARGRFLLCLDADDYLLPRAVEHLLRRYAAGDVGYVYGNAYTEEPERLRGQFAGNPAAKMVDGKLYMFRPAPDYDQRTMASYNIHVVTALVPIDRVRQVGGFDERVDAWEDWTLWLRLAIAGVCGERIPHPVFTYRVYEGERMTQWYGDRSTMETVWSYYKNPAGEIPMASCCGGDANLARQAAAAVQGIRDADALNVGTDRVRIEYLGEEKGSIPIGLPDGSTVKVGNNARHRYQDVPKWVAEYLATMVAIRVVTNFDEPGPPPAALPILEAADVLTPDTNVKALRPKRSGG